MNITRANDGFRQVSTRLGTRTLSVYDVHLVQGDETCIFPDYYQGKAIIDGLEYYVRTGDEHPRVNSMFYVGQEVANAQEEVK